MGFIRVVVSAFLCLFAPLGHAGNAYLCIPELTTGFAYHRGTHDWHLANFKSDNQYIVSRPQGGAAWQVTQVGRATPAGFCRRDFTKAGILTCEGFDEFKMNRTNMRFLHAYLVGYWTDNGDHRFKGNPALFKEGENTPFLEIGKCAPM